VRLIHTGQHEGAAMSDVFFRDLGLPAPDVELHARGGTHAAQTAAVLLGIEADLSVHRPAMAVVVGDVTSTLAAALAAAKLGVPVVHVEAGLRSRDWTMPEEINRVVTDHIADLLLIPSRDAADNLAAEGIARERVRFVGNVMIDSLRANLPRAVPPAETLRRAGVTQALDDRYALVTLHRPSNVDDPDSLRESLELLHAVSARLSLVCPLHPRTGQNIERFGLGALLAPPRIVVLPPQGYLETLGLMASAAVVLTDSGGIQEETTALGVPCLTMRENTERPITVEEGTNTLVGRDRAAAVRLVDEILTGGGKRGRAPQLWDGRAAERIAEHLAGWLVRRRAHVGA